MASACANVICATQGCLGMCKNELPPFVAGSPWCWECRTYHSPVVGCAHPVMRLTDDDIRMFDAALFRSIEVIHRGELVEPRREICGELEDGA